MHAIRASVIAFALLGASAAFAVPTTLTYAAVLKDNGAPVNTTVDVTFAIFDASTGGNQLYTETQSSLVILNGDLVTEIGQNALDDSVLDAPSIFLAVNVDGDDFSPRVRLSSVPYALRAQKAASAATADVADALGSLAEADVVTQAQLVTLHLDQGLAAGSGVTLTGGTLSIANGAITNAMLADGSVTTAKIGDGQVTTAKLGDSQVTGAKIVDATITNADVAANAGIDGTKLGLNSVTTSQIHDNTIVDADIAAGAAISGAKLANNAIGTAQIATGVVTRAKLSGTAEQVRSGPRACNLVLTTSAVCFTEMCSIVSGAPRFFDCASTCNQTTAQQCSTVAEGFIIGATAQ